MDKAESYLPRGFTASEELLAEKAECRDCGAVVLEDARAWSTSHVQETGHNIHLTLHYDLRDEHWLSRLSYERLAEIERVRNPPED